jgi:hypothetical protein
MSQAHNSTGKLCKALPWRVCTKCGLVHLNNDATKTELKKPCKGDDK